MPNQHGDFCEQDAESLRGTERELPARQIKYLLLLQQTQDIGIDLLCDIPRWCRLNSRLFTEKCPQLLTKVIDKRQGFCNQCRSAPKLNEPEEKCKGTHLIVIRGRNAFAFFACTLCQSFNMGEAQAARTHKYTHVHTRTHMYTHAHTQAVIMAVKNVKITCYSSPQNVIYLFMFVCFPMLYISVADGWDWIKGFFLFFLNESIQKFCIAWLLWCAPEMNPLTCIVLKLVVEPHDRAGYLHRRVCSVHFCCAYL